MKFTLPFITSAMMAIASAATPVYNSTVLVSDNAPQDPNAGLNCYLAYDACVKSCLGDQDCIGSICDCICNDTPDDVCDGEDSYRKG